MIVTQKLKKIQIHSEKQDKNADSLTNFYKNHICSRSQKKKVKP